MNAYAIRSGSEAAQDALGIVLQARERLVRQGQDLWTYEGLEEEVLSGDGQVVLYRDKPVACMLLTWHDPEVWPELLPNTAAYIHKLAVADGEQGKGHVDTLLAYAKARCKERGVERILLDCAADRPKLRARYENAGFVYLGTRVLYDVYVQALYELRISIDE